MKNFILKGITYIAILLWLLTVALLDSETYFTQILLVNVLSGLWIISHLYLNQSYYSK